MGSRASFIMLRRPSLRRHRPKIHHGNLNGSGKGRFDITSGTSHGSERVVFPLPIARGGCCSLRFRPGGCCFGFFFSAEVACDVFECVEGGGGGCFFSAKVTCDVFECVES